MAADRWRLRALTLGVMATGLLAASPAMAYRVIGWDWTWMRNPVSTPFYVNPSGFPATIGTQQQVTNALADGMAIWETEGASDFSFTYGGTTTRTSFSADGTFITQYSNTTVAGGTLAVSQSWGFNNDMTECDQRYYARNAYGAINWSADPNGASWSEIDLEHTAIHEYGHCAGLDHSSNGNAIMYASTTGGMGPADRHLHSDDIAGLQSMYGAIASNDLVLEINGAVIAGQSHTFTISDADPGERVYILFSTGGVGPGPCPAALGNGAICLGIRNPFLVLASGNANNNGVATITASIPSQYQGWTLGYQAGALRGVNGRDSVLSNAEAVLTLNPGTTCPGGTVPDCAGACFDGSWVGDGGCDDGTLYRWGDPDFNCGAYAYDAGDCSP
jgi:hypothetical protein